MQTNYFNAILLLLMPTLLSQLKTPRDEEAELFGEGCLNVQS